MTTYTVRLPVYEGPLSIREVAVAEDAGERPDDRDVVLEHVLRDERGDRLKLGAVRPDPVRAGSGGAADQLVVHGDRVG